MPADKNKKSTSKKKVDEGKTTSTYTSLYGTPQLNLTSDQIQQAINIDPKQQIELRKEVLSRKPYLYSVEDYKQGITEPGVETTINPVELLVPVAAAEDLLVQGATQLGKVAAKKVGTKIASKLAKSAANKTKSKLSKAVEGTSSVINEVKGKLLQDKANKKSIEEGNKWLDEWIQDPITQAKIEKDLNNTLSSYSKNESFYPSLEEYVNLVKEQAKTFKPNTKEYSLYKQIDDNLNQYFGEKTKPIHQGNWGVSYMHNYSPKERDKALKDILKNDPRYGSWVSRSTKIPQKSRVSTTVHEGTHDWTSPEIFNLSGMRNTALKNMNPNIKKDFLEWEKLRSSGIDPVEKMGKERAYQAYLADPTEQHARIMELRKELNLKPKYEIDSEYAQQIIDWIDTNSSEVKPEFLNVIDRDPKKLANLFNNFWMAPPTIIGASMLNQENIEQKAQGGYLDTNRGKEFSEDRTKRGYYYYLGESGKSKLLDKLALARSRRNAYKKGGKVEDGEEDNTSDEVINGTKIVRGFMGDSHYSPEEDTVYISAFAEDENEELDHEMYHAQQAKSGRLRVEEDDPYGAARRKPSIAEEKALVDYPYYNRRVYDQKLLEHNFLHGTRSGERNPSFNLVPFELIYNNVYNPQMYNTPWMAEGEARAAETPKGRRYLAERDIAPEFHSGFYSRAEGGWLDDYSIENDKNNTKSKKPNKPEIEPFYVTDPNDRRITEYQKSKKLIEEGKLDIFLRPVVYREPVAASPQQPVQPNVKKSKREVPVGDVFKYIDNANEYYWYKKSPSTTVPITKEEFDKRSKKAEGGWLEKYADGGKIKKEDNNKAWNPNLGKKDKEFLEWYKNNTLEGKHGIPFNSKESVYDFYSYYKNTPKFELSNPNAHFPDTYKYPTHPTFSNESIYSTPEKPGGKWDGETYIKKGKFIYKNGGYMFANGGKYITVDGEYHRVYENKDGDIIVNHPREDKGKWDTINLTDKANAKTVADGVKSVKKWHKENPETKAKGGWLNKYM